LRKLARERGKFRWKIVRRDGWNHADGQRARDGILALNYIAPGGFEFAQDGAGARQESFADIGEADGTPQAIEKARSEFVLKFEDLLGERRLRDVGMLGGAAERTGLGHGAEVTELMEFHRGS